jgi:hypothetical protein
MPNPDDQTASPEADLRAISSTLHLDPSVVQQFIADYLRLLPTRLHRIDDDLERGDVPAATVSLLSLATSSTMLGADEVSDAAQRVQEGSAAGNQAAVRDGRRLLLSTAEHTRARLARLSSRN